MESQEKAGKIFDNQTLKRLLPFLGPYKTTFYALISLTVFLGFLSPLRPIIIQYAIDNFVSTKSYSGLLNMVLIMFGILFLQAIGTYFQTYLSSWLGQTIIRDIRELIHRGQLDATLAPETDLETP